MTCLLKQAGVAEVKTVYNILFDCGQHLQTNFGLSHWSPPYPLESLKKSIIERQVYLVWQDNQAIATFTLGTTPLANYALQRWQRIEDKALYLNRLAVSPHYQGRGLGRWCMQQIEELAKIQGCQAVRFDAVAQHQILLQFYQQLGYQERGLWTLQDTQGIAWEVMLLEKLL